MNWWRQTRRAGLVLTGLLLVGGTGFGPAPGTAAQAVDPTGYAVTINSGACPAPDTTAAYEVGTTLPWGLSESDTNAVTEGSVLHVQSTLNEPLDNLLQEGQPFTVVVTSPDATAAVVACGDIVNLVDNGQLAIALTPVGASGVAGVALLDNDAQGLLGLGGDEVQVTAYVLAGLGAGAAPTATAVVTATAPPSAPTTTPAAASGAGTAPAGLGITVDAHDLYFEPNVIVLPADTDVTITFTNEGQAVHNFSVTDHNNAGLENLNIDVTINPGETRTFTVNAPAGDYYFFCNQPGHEAAGMRGYLQIQDGAAISSSEATVTPRPE